MSWPFDPFKPLSYQMIMVAPPWKYDNWSKAGEQKNASAKYDCMSLDDIAALPVSQLAAGDALCWLWCTNPMLDVQIDILKHWGFRFTTSGHWAKMTTKGNQHFGTGYVLRNAGEPFIIGKIGNPVCARNVRSVIIDEVRAHSQKPEKAYAAAEQLVPGALKRIEGFSRTDRPGWDSWGNETGMLNPVEDA